MRHVLRTCVAIGKYRAEIFEALKGARKLYRAPAAELLWQMNRDEDLILVTHNAVDDMRVALVTNDKDVSLITQIETLLKPIQQVETCPLQRRTLWQKITGSEKTKRTSVYHNCIEGCFAVPKEDARRIFGEVMAIRIPTMCV